MIELEAINAALNAIKTNYRLVLLSHKATGRSA
jgi:hypothetical protein